MAQTFVSVLCAYRYPSRYDLYVYEAENTFLIRGTLRPNL